MSGDPDTSDGNTTCNEALICHLMRGVEFREKVLGDDSVIIFNREHLQVIKDRMEEHAKNKTYPWVTVYSFAFEFEHVEFCQCRPVWTINGYVMVRNPKRMLTRGLTCISQTVVKNPHQFYDWLRAVGDCEWSVNPGVPVLTAIAQYMRSFSSRPIKEPHDTLYFKTIRREYNHTITQSARLSFYMAFGISVQNQYVIEKWFNSNSRKKTYTVRNIIHPYSGNSEKYLNDTYST